jgi:hypothetical protein
MVTGAPRLVQYRSRIIDHSNEKHSTCLHSSCSVHIHQQ